MKQIKTIYVYPPLRAAGMQHVRRWMAYYEGEEGEGHARGWGQTAAEAEKELVKSPLLEPPREPMKLDGDVGLGTDDAGD